MVRQADTNTIPDLGQRVNFWPAKNVIQESLQVGPVTKAVNSLWL